MVNLDSLLLLIRMQQLEQLQRLNSTEESSGTTDSSNNFATILSGLLGTADNSGEFGVEGLGVEGLGVGGLGLGGIDFTSLALAGLSSDFNSDLSLATGNGTTLSQPTTSINRTSSLDQIFNELAAKYNLSPTLLKTVAEAESSLNPHAVSPAGAQGIMQLMPATAKGLGVTDPFDPVQNIEGGAKYLKSLLDRFDNNVPMALAAYNAGPYAVKKYGGIPPYKETQKYVNKIMSNLVDCTG